MLALLLALTTVTPNPNLTSLFFKTRWQAVSNLTLNPSLSSQHLSITLTRTNNEFYKIAYPQSLVRVDYSPTHQAFIGTTPRTIPLGIYDITITGPFHLPQKFNHIDLSRPDSTGVLQDLTLKPLLAGDFDHTTAIDSLDISSILNNYTLLSQPGSAYDVNLDGQFNLRDIAAVFSNYTHE